MSKLSLRIDVSISQQTLSLYRADDLIRQYSISSSKKGIGFQKNSNKTPLGLHYIRAKIGADQPINTVFVGRRPTGEIYDSALAKQYPQRDWILSRILWLSGCEKYKNRLGQVDTMQRFIYIHGTPDTEPMGQPLSEGCIRMSNEDVVELFDLATVGTEVNIQL